MIAALWLIVAGVWALVLGIDVILGIVVWGGLLIVGIALWDEWKKLRAPRTLASPVPPEPEQPMGDDGVPLDEWTRQRLVRLPPEEPTRG